MLEIGTAAGLWGLTDIVPIADTPGSSVYRARTAEGVSVVAKLIKPRGMAEMSGMDYLVWRGGRGAVSVIARRANACLLEDAGKRTLEDLRAESGEHAANKVFAEILSSLHSSSPRPFPAALTPLARHFRALAERGAPAHADHAENLIWAAELARGLLARQESIMPLHGDLHHLNIMSRDGRAWQAIDPHGLLGDPAYDAANFFGNPLSRPDITCDPERIVGIARNTAAVIGCGTRKILEYSAAHAALSACWSIDDPISESDLKDANDRLAFLTVVRRLIARLSHD